MRDPKYLLRKILSVVLLGGGAAFVVAVPVSAEGTEERFPRLEAEIDIEIQDDWTFDSDDPAAELNDLFTTTEPAVALYLLPGLSIQSGLVLEPVKGPGPADDRYFEDHGLFAEQLYLLYEQDRFSLHGGKFNLPFGVAWDRAPGVYGTDVAEAFYEQVERIGIGGTLNFGGDGIGGSGFGEHRLSVQTFFLDTTFLSESFGTNRGRTRVSDGGVSNTEDFSSFAVSLDGGDFPDLPLELNYHLGLAYQDGGVGASDDELGIAVALYGGIELGPKLTLEPIVEYVHFENAGGARQDRDIFTAGASLVQGPWNLALSYSGVRTDPEGSQPDRDVDQFQVSSGYSFDFGVDLDIGYKFVDDEGVESHVVGMILHYAFDFAIPD
ncbi:MAG: porin [Proteobacteria bacterium]|nr:porin [Pseudomonadota bacterium]